MSHFPKIYFFIFPSQMKDKIKFVISEPYLLMYWCQNISNPALACEAVTKNSARKEAAYK